MIGQQRIEDSNQRASRGFGGGRSRLPRGSVRSWLLLLLLCWLPIAAAAADAGALFAAKLYDFDDRPYALTQLQAQPLIVNFWARWCGPCRKEIPELAAAHERHQAQGLRIIGIALDDKAEATRDFAKAYDMNYLGLLAKDAGIPLMQALGNPKAVVPFTLLIDRNGQIVGSKLGPMDAAEIEAAARRLLGGV